MLPDVLGTHAFAGTAIIGRTAIGLFVCLFVQTSSDGPHCCTHPFLCLLIGCSKYLP
jgi:hypothetical protein